MVFWDGLVPQFLRYRGPFHSQHGRIRREETRGTGIAMETPTQTALVGLAGLVIVALAGGIAWLTVLHAASTGSITEFSVPTASLKASRQDLMATSSLPSTVAARSDASRAASDVRSGCGTTCELKQ